MTCCQMAPALLLERRPATVFLIEAGALRGGVVQQTLADLSPDCVCPVRARGVCFLNFHDPLAAAAAGDAQQVAVDLRELVGLDRLFGANSIGARVPEERCPVRSRQLVCWTDGRRGVFADGRDIGQLLDLFHGRKAPTSESVGRAQNRT